MTGERDDRQRLATELRGLRTDAGLSTTRLAKALGWSQSKVSKTELGRTAPPADDVAAWCVATGASSETRAELVAIAEAAAHQATEWRKELAPGRRRKQEEIQDRERNASVIRVFSPDVVVGLVQTRRYAEAMFRLGRRLVGPPEEPSEEIIAARLARQTVLDDTDKRFYLLMGEMVLHRLLVPPAALREQLQHLVEMTSRPNVAIGIIPFDAEERVHQYHGFAVLGDPEVDDEALVLAETVTRGLTIRAADEVGEYVAHFEGLRSAAIEGDQLRKRLLERIAQLPRP